LLDVLGIGEDLTVDGFELVGAWPEHLHNDVRSVPWRGELETILAALDEVKDQVSDVEGSTPYSLAVVPSQHLLVLGRSEEGNIAHFVQLVHGAFEGRAQIPIRHTP